MSNPSKGARLWLRPASPDREAVWIIRDGPKMRSTGCGPADSERAEQKLAQYLAKKPQPGLENEPRPEVGPVVDVPGPSKQSRALQGGTAADPRTIDRNAPLRLAVAAELAFPFRGMTAAGLRKEVARGNLAVERIAGKDYTTLAAIEAMRNRCRTHPKEPACGSAPPPLIDKPSGLSEMAQRRVAQDAAWLTLEELRERSRGTSPANAGRGGKAT